MPAVMTSYHKANVATFPWVAALSSCVDLICGCELVRLSNAVRSGTNRLQWFLPIERKMVVILEMLVIQRLNDGMKLLVL